MGIFNFFKQEQKSPPRIEPTLVKDFGTSDAYSDNIGWSPLIAPFTRSHTGMEISPVRALGCGVIFSCVRLLVGDIAKLPLRLLQLKDDVWQEVKYGNPKTDYLLDLIRRPNKRMTPHEFKSNIVLSLLLVGNSYSVVKRDDSGRPIEIIPVIPSLVSVLEDVNGDLTFLITSRMLWPKITGKYSEEDVAVVRAFSLDGGIHGVSMVQLVSDVIGIGLATQELVATMFDHGANIQGYLTTDQVGIPKETVDTIKENWTNAASGLHNSGKTPFLQANVKYNDIGINAANWQMVEARKQIVEECARIFNIPLSKLSSNEKSAYNSIDAQNQDYIDTSLGQLTTPIEEALDRVLLFDDQIGKLKFAFDFSVLEKGDVKTRTQYFKDMQILGNLNSNEVRREMNLPPREGGDVYTQAMNTGVIGDKSGMDLKPSDNEEVDNEDGADE